MAAETITEQEHNAELPSGVPTKVMGVDAENNTVLCTPNDVANMKKLGLYEAVPDMGNFFGSSSLGTFVGDVGDGGGFQFKVSTDDSGENPIFRVRAWNSVSSYWSSWKTVSFT